MAGKSYQISSQSKHKPDPTKDGRTLWTERTVLGRNALSWFKIIVFYIIYYICLTAFSFFCYYIFSQTLIDNEPKLKLKDSVIGSNPGVGFRPVPDQDSNAESSLIWYNHNSESDAKFWYSQLDDFVKKSEFPEGTEGVRDCNIGGDNFSSSHSCRVPVNMLRHCSSDNHYGYLEGKPCVLLKLNRIYGWEPQPFGVKDGKFDMETLDKELNEMIQHKGMPSYLAKAIKEQIQNHPAQVLEILKTVWISCQGENVGDKESLPEQNISYEPFQGIPGYFFPYLNQKNYKSPFVMARLDIPITSRHVLINIECRAWAKNIHYDKASRLGSVHFEVMID